jgi:putative nucleotidyltransferase with HDIG domain
LSDFQELRIDLSRLPALPRPSLRAYAAGLATIALVTAVLLAFAGYLPGAPAAVLALGVVGAIAERSRVRLTPSLELSISLVPTLFAAVVLGPLAAMVVAAASMAADLRAQPGVPHPRLKWTVYTATSAITGAATGMAAHAGAGLAGSSVGSALVATAFGAIAAQTIDAFFCALTLWVRNSGRLVEEFRTLAPVIAISVPLYTPVVALLAYAYVEVSPWTLPLFLVPALAAQGLFGLYQEQRRLAEDVLATNERLERANLSFASALVATLDARDRYTAGHSQAVAVYSRDIAVRLGLPDDQQQLAHLAGMVHDIGKIGLPPGLLEKPGALTLEERRQMEKHSEIGERILANVEDYQEVANIVRHHHERFDGEGYPDRLAGPDIPLISRIIGVADAYNAMTSDRPYRDAMPSRVARLRLAQAADTQFDTAVVAAFEAILAGATEAYRLAKTELSVADREPERVALRIASSF